MGGIQEDRLLKINIRSLLNFYYPTLILVFCALVILYYMRFDKYFVQAFLFVWIIIDLLPALYLHITYFQKNKGEEYEIQKDALIKRKNGKEITYRNNEIEKIVVYLSPALYKNSDLHFLSIEDFHYAVVKLKTGEELILTCLLTPRIDKALKQIQGVLFEKKRQLFCRIKENID